MIHRNNPEHITSQEIVANAEKINKIQYLPPQLLSLTKQHNYYGKIVFKIDWLKEKRQGSLVRYAWNFLGNDAIGSASQLKPIQYRETCYSIVTNLWHFYVYLSDMKRIRCQFENVNKKQFVSIVPIELMKSSHILNPLNQHPCLYLPNSYLLPRYPVRCAIKDQQGNEAGELAVSINLQFEQSINKMLFEAGTIEFQQMLIIDQISPISSKKDLEQRSEQPSINLVASKAERQTSRIKVQTNILDDFSQQKSVSKPKSVGRPDTANPLHLINRSPIGCAQQEYEDEQQVQLEIDRMILEMQNKPYDGSRYIDKQNNGFSKTVQYTVTTNRRDTNIQDRGPQYDILEIDEQQKRSDSLEKQSIGRSLPPRYPKLIKSHSQTQFSQRSSSISHTQPSPLTTGTIHLTIHELAIQGGQLTSDLLLRVYVNDEQQEQLSVQGTIAGEMISFDSQVSFPSLDINKMQFRLFEIGEELPLARGTFELKRLYSITSKKGVFMISLSPCSLGSQGPRNDLRVSENHLRKIVPIHRTLRLELQYQQKHFMVQLYLNLSNFTLSANKCRYKIPLTKETIEFSNITQQNHINVFPHSLSSYQPQKIILQVWAQLNIIGVSQINLQAMQHTNQKLMTSSLEPTCLFDGTKQINQLVEQKVIGSYHLQLFCGTVQQIQSKMNSDRNGRKNKPEVQTRNVEVTQQLGVFVKERKNNKEVQIQVGTDTGIGKESNCLKKFQKIEQTPPKIVHKISKKQQLKLKQQQLSDSDENEFLNDDEEIKQTNKVKSVPIPLPSPAKAQTIVSPRTPSAARNLTKDLAKIMKDSLESLAIQTRFQRLKDACKPHLLYNFIEQPTLQQILHELSVPAVAIGTMSRYCLEMLNGMINISILYDLIYGVILHDEIKEQNISERVLGLFCLEELYQAEKNKAPQSGNAKGSKTRKNPQCVFTPDIDYQQAKKIYLSFGCKLSLREYHAIIAYLQKEQQTTKKPPQWEQVKEKILYGVKEIQDIRTIEHEYEKEIVGKIYSHWTDQDEDDYIINNLNRKEVSKEKPMASIKQSGEDKTRSDNTSANSMETVLVSKMEQVAEKQQTLLSNTVQSEIPKLKTEITKPLQVETSETVTAKSSVTIAVNEHPHKQDSSTISPSLSQRLINYMFHIQGVATCLDSTECHLNTNLDNAVLQISFSNDTQPFQLLYQNPKQVPAFHFPIQLLPSQLIDGSVTLLQKDRPLAKCNFSMLPNIKSVYVLKSFPEGQFCGLLHLTGDQTM